MRLKPEAATVLGISVRQLERRLANGQYPTSTDSGGRVLIDIGSDAATAEAELFANYRTGSEVFAASAEGLQVITTRLLDDRRAERTEHAATVAKLEKRLDLETSRTRRLGILAAILAIVASSALSWQWQATTRAAQEPQEPRRQTDVTTPAQTAANVLSGSEAQPSALEHSDTLRPPNDATTGETDTTMGASHDAETVAVKTKQ